MKYFPGLNALRFFAASAVVIGHTEQLKSWKGLDVDLKTTSRISELAVTFFFVLSGFLITNLLLQERKKTRTISVRKFYLRRILRIWPLYFLVLFLTFVIIPHVPAFQLFGESAYKGAPENIILHLLMLPNVALVMWLVIPYASQVWSIGVEEQFYAIWPLCVKYVRNIQWFMLGIIFAFIVARLVAHWMHRETLSYLLNLTRIDCMAIGALAGYYIYKNNRYFKFLIDWKIKYSMILLIALFIFTGLRVPHLNYQVHSVACCLLIVNISCTGKFTFLETPFFRLLGDLSYGMYMLHLIAIGLVFIFIPASGFVLHVLTLSVTILLAYLSFTFFEQPFLKVKERYSPLKGKRQEKPVRELTG